mgnify:CR=1 FL=1
MIRWKKKGEFVYNTISSSIRDNRNRGSVGDFLKEKISKDSSLAFVSAYFTGPIFIMSKKRKNKKPAI